ncbi:ZIP family metal transporter [Jatrophihabitans cynanchi]|jgi:ZIP family zinc transporter|uniref:ZIP family metal transporter n=1 Tax=Jatrophihabitans cynanchi TaxID=2944128 RepID=A0ABY7K2I2_9ACTN|nr:ZIP family metal transporter [Jatrophihabitans sp. SB3-54]WAX58713.1 ZIP family metal transporter [Jatrophihabitans sp. SB3-54]
MSLTKTLILGLIAGVTIVLGIPLGRIRRPMPSLRLLLNAIAVGILLFLVWDVLSAAWEPIDGALSAAHDHVGGLAPAFGYGALFVLGVSVGLLSLVGYERYMAATTARVTARAAAAAADRTEIAGPAGNPVVAPPEPGPALAGTAVQVRPVRIPGIAGWSPARRLALLIAVGIGLHNFAEGLAIGQSAASGEIALATMLVIGFGLHNATEGFGIVAPLAGDLDDDGSARRPSWGFLLLLALIGGGPTFVGTIVGHGFTSEAVSVVFLTLAAGSIIYVVTQLLGVAARAKRPDLLAIGLLIGLLAGFATDAVVGYAGA